MRYSKQTVIFGIFISSLLLSACGQKGPLFIPDDEQAEIQATQLERAQAEQAANTEKPAAEVEVIDGTADQNQAPSEKKKTPAAE